MRRFLTGLFITLVLAIGAAGGAPAARADCVPGTPNCDPCPAGDSACVANAQSFTSTYGALSVDAAAAKTSKTLPPSPDMSSGFGTIMIWIMSLFAWLVGIAAITLDSAVYHTVVNMGSYVNNLSAVGVTWGIMRDIGNIVLIFGFLAAGIATILNIDLYGWGKKMLPTLLVAAIFMNFSLFLAEAVIDTGNLFATQFYTQINGGDPAGAKSFDPGLSIGVSNEGISNKIMSQLGLQTIYGDANRNQELFKAGNTWIIGFMGIILFIITAFVMFSLAFILIARFVILLFLIILAPVGFAGLIVPKLNSSAQKWWSQLFEQTITAPILLLLLYVALTVISDEKFLVGFGTGTNSGGWTGWVTSATGTNNLPGLAALMISFLVAIGLLLAVVILSKKLGAFGGSWATATAGKLTFGATAWAGRTTVGWGTHRAAKYLRGTAFSRIPLVGTGITRGLEGIASSNFDVRGVKFGGGLKGVGVDAGDAQKGGYRADLKARVESRTKYASELKGRELSDDEKDKLAALQNELKELEKEKASAKGADAVRVANENIKKKEKEIEIAEEKTDKGAKRKYAGNLELDYLGIKPKGVFNTVFNFAANTEAAKKIREDAKKSKDEEGLDALRKALKKAGGEEAEEKPKDEKKGESKSGGEEKSETPKS